MAKNASISTDQTKEIEHLFQMGAHLGHRKSRVHPKSYRYIHKFLNGVSIIDLTKTVHLLNKARTNIAEAAKEGKKILVVATKKNHAAMAAEAAETFKVPYATTKWLPGLLTNFEQIIKNVQNMEKMRAEQAEGTWEQFVKHERMSMSKQLYKLERFYKGMAGVTKRPDILIIIDARKEKNSIVEAKKNSLPVFGIVDTNSNPEDVDFPIVMNDDSPEVVKYVLEDLLKTYSDNYVEKKAAEGITVGEDGVVNDPSKIAPKSEAKAAEPKKTETKKPEVKVAEATEEVKPAKEEKAPAKKKAAAKKSK